MKIFIAATLAGVLEKNEKMDMRSVGAGMIGDPRLWMVGLGMSAMADG